MIIFGLLVGLTVQAASAERFDLWILLMTVGTFAGAYPLMYFAQEYISLELAVLFSAGIVIAIIGIRVLTLMPMRWAILGIILPAAAIMAVTLVAAIWKPLQGILLTAEAMAFFIGVMTLMPKIHAASGTFWAIHQNPLPLFEKPQASEESGVTEQKRDSN